MPSLKTSQASNPLAGAGIVRYFNDDEGVKIEPTIFIGITVAFIIIELALNLFM